MTKFENDVDEFVKILADFDTKKAKLTNVFNPWRDYDRTYDIDENSPIIRCNNLREYLISREKAKYVLIAEAPGYQGCHFSGIPMTSERLIKEKCRIYALEKLEPRTSDKNNKKTPKTVQKGGFCERTATIVWKQMVDGEQQKIKPKEFVLWNAFPFHPYQSKSKILTNRSPLSTEIISTTKILEKFLTLFPNKKYIAIGLTAQKTLDKYFGKYHFERVPHPSYTGTKGFREGIKIIIKPS